MAANEIKGARARGDYKLFTPRLIRCCEDPADRRVVQVQVACQLRLTIAVFVDGLGDQRVSHLFLAAFLWEELR